MTTPIRWTAPEFHYYEKDHRWHVAVRIGALVILLIALWQGNFLFAVFTVIAAFLFSSWGSKPPQTRTFTLTERELHIAGGKTYPHDRSEGFTIIEAPGHPPELVIKTKERLHMWLHVIIPADLAPQIQELLIEYLPEIDYDESLGDKLGRLLKF
jgi:hypothetical protein